MTASVRTPNDDTDTTMALPKDELLLLVAVFAAIGLVTATGAFTTVTADRTATVTVAGDAGALLGLAPYDGPNGDGSDDTNSITDDTQTGDSEGYAGLNGDVLEIDLGGYGDVSAVGVNDEATTDVRNVFVVTNQGTQPVAVSVTDSDDDGEDTFVTFYNSSYADRSGGGLENDDEGGSAVVLGTGEHMVVSVHIDTTDTGDLAGDGLLDGDVTVTASADNSTLTDATDGPGNDKS